MSSSIRTSGPAGIPPHGHATEREVLRESVKHDYATEKSGGIVPLDRRRRLWSMAALWLTMNCGFGEIFIGFEYHQAGFTLLKSVAVSLIGCALYFCYAVPAAYLGTRTGQAGVRGVLDQTLAFEDLQGFADRDPAHPEAGRDIVRTDGGTGQQLSVLDRTAQRVQHDLLGRWRALKLRHRHPSWFGHTSMSGTARPRRLPRMQ
jgi:hypothetical protein